MQDAPPQKSLATYLRAVTQSLRTTGLYYKKKKPMDVTKPIFVVKFHFLFKSHINKLYHSSPKTDKFKGACSNDSWSSKCINKIEPVEYRKRKEIQTTEKTDQFPRSTWREPSERQSLGQRTQVFRLRLAAGQNGGERQAETAETNKFFMSTLTFFRVKGQSDRYPPLLRYFK